MKNTMNVTRYGIDWKKADLKVSEITIAAPANVRDIVKFRTAMESCQIDNCIAVATEKLTVKMQTIESFKSANSFNRDRMAELEKERDNLQALIQKLNEMNKVHVAYKHTIAHATAYVLFPIVRGTKSSKNIPALLDSAYIDALDLLHTGALTDKSKGLQALANKLRDAMNRFIENDGDDNMSKRYKARVNLENTRNVCYTIIGKYNFSRSGIKCPVYDEREFSRQVILMCLQKTFDFTDVIKASNTCNII